MEEETGLALWLNSLGLPSTLAVDTFRDVSDSTLCEVIGLLVDREPEEELCRGVEVLERTFGIDLADVKTRLGVELDEEGKRQILTIMRKIHRAGLAEDEAEGKAAVCMGESKVHEDTKPLPIPPPPAAYPSMLKVLSNKVPQPESAKQEKVVTFAKEEQVKEYTYSITPPFITNMLSRIAQLIQTTEFFDEKVRDLTRKTLADGLVLSYLALEFEKRMGYSPRRDSVSRKIGNETIMFFAGVEVNARSRAARLKNIEIALSAMREWKRFNPKYLWSGPNIADCLTDEGLDLLEEMVTFTEKNVSKKAGLLSTGNSLLTKVTENGWTLGSSENSSDEKAKTQYVPPPPPPPPLTCEDEDEREIHRPMTPPSPPLISTPGTTFIMKPHRRHSLSSPVSDHVLHDIGELEPDTTALADSPLDVEEVKHQLSPSVDFSYKLSSRTRRPSQDENREPIMLPASPSSQSFMDLLSSPPPPPPPPPRPLLLQPLPTGYHSSRSKLQTRSDDTRRHSLEPLAPRSSLAPRPIAPSEQLLLDPSPPTRSRSNLMMDENESPESCQQRVQHLQVLNSQPIRLSTVDQSIPALLVTNHNLSFYMNTDICDSVLQILAYNRDKGDSRSAKERQHLTRMWLYRLGFNILRTNIHSRRSVPPDMAISKEFWGYEGGPFLGDPIRNGCVLLEILRLIENSFHDSLDSPGGTKDTASFPSAKHRVKYVMFKLEQLLRKYGLSGMLDFDESAQGQVLSGGPAVWNILYALSLVFDVEPDDEANTSWQLIQDLDLVETKSGLITDEDIESICNGDVLRRWVLLIEKDDGKESSKRILSTTPKTRKAAIASIEKCLELLSIRLAEIPLPIVARRIHDGDIRLFFRAVLAAPLESIHAAKKSRNKPQPRTPLVDQNKINSIKITFNVKGKSERKARLAGVPLENERINGGSASHTKPLLISNNTISNRSSLWSPAPI